MNKLLFRLFARLIANGALGIAQAEKFVRVDNWVIIRMYDVVMDF